MSTRLLNSKSFFVNALCEIHVLGYSKFSKMDSFEYLGQKSVVSVLTEM